MIPKARQLAGRPDPKKPTDTARFRWGSVPRKRRLHQYKTIQELENSKIQNKKSIVFDLKQILHKGYKGILHSGQRFTENGKMIWILSEGDAELLKTKRKVIFVTEDRYLWSKKNAFGEKAVDFKEWKRLVNQLG